MGERDLFPLFCSTLARLGLADARPLAVAVSGGADSIALAHLTLRWAQKTGADAFAYTVDHRLRETSTAEAAAVVQTLAAQGLPCRILTWSDASAGSGLQERARAARYALLAEAARADGIRDVLLAHHADDQAETFWMRLADGSGLSGLAGMGAEVVRDGVSWWRPLLDVTRSDLRAYGAAFNLPVIEDPSNENPRFLRVRLRGFAEALAQEGLTPTRMNRTIGKLAEAEAALAHVAGDMWRARSRVHPAGAICLDLADWDAAPRDLRRRLVQRAVMTLSSSPYPPAYDALVLLADQVAQHDFTAATLAGCYLVRRNETLWVMREAAALPPEQQIDAGSSDTLIWDRRFVISGLHALAGQEIALAPLGEAGWERLEPAAKELWAEKWGEAPAALRATIPVFRKGEKVLFIPLLNWTSGDGCLANLPGCTPALIV